MAKKEEKKNVLERTYNVPLRKEYMKAPRWKRSPKAAKALKEFISKHMKAKDVKIGKFVNKEIWKHGMKNPPHHVKVEANKNSEGIVFVELVGAPKEVKVEKKPVKKTADIRPNGLKKIAEKLEKNGEEKEKKEGLESTVETKDDKAEQAKEIQKEEIKEIKKEQPKPVKQPAVPKSVEQHPTAPMKK